MAASSSGFIAHSPKAQGLAVMLDHGGGSVTGDAACCGAIFFLLAAGIHPGHAGAVTHGSDNDRSLLRVFPSGTEADHAGLGRHL